MKKAFIYSLIATLSLTFTAASTFAAPLANPAPKPATATPADPSTTIGATGTMTLAERKLAAEMQLRESADKLSLFATRTQLALDRLTTKGIATTAAQTELISATTTLALAKANLDLFGALTVKDGDDTTVLKDALKTIEVSLTDARTHLIASLVALKVAVSAQ